MRGAAVRRSAGLFAGQIALFLLVMLAVGLCTPLHVFLLEGTGAGGLSPLETREVAYAMTASMRGEGEAALGRWFTQDEIAHMRDVRALVLFGWRATAVCAALCLALVWPGKARLSPRAKANCALAALIAIALCAAAVAAAFTVDFHAAFVVFHRVFFPGNTLWLMDPRIHRMVVIYNEAFFTRCAGVIGAGCLVSLAPLAILAARGRRKSV